MSHHDIVVALCQELGSTEGKPPGWIQLLPLGPEVKGRDGRGWRMSDADVIAKRFEGDIPIDWEHATELRAPKGATAPAAGWIKELVAVKNQAALPDGSTLGPGMWGRVEWTPRGANSVQSHEYRFISPVFTHTADGQIVQLISAALTNRPNLDLKSLNRAEEPGQSQENIGMTEEELRALRSKLGLAVDASGAAILAALNAREVAQTQTNINLVPRADLEAALNRANAAESALAAREKADHDREVEAVLDGAVKDGKVSPASRDHYRALCSSKEGLTSVKTLIASLPSITSPAPKGTSPAPGDDSSNHLTAAEKARCQRLGISEESFLAAKRSERTNLEG